jgi:hypothetical protein
MLKKITLALALMLGLMAAIPAHAQEGDALTLRLSRNFGYSSGTGKVQGSFTLKASGVDDLVRVTFFIDGEPLGEGSAEPFEVRFVTDDYPLGLHTLHALGVTASGQEYRSNEIRAEFVTADEGWQAAIRIMLPVMGLFLIAMTLSLVVTFASGRKFKDLPAGAPRHYGYAGGAVCPRCGRPFPRHLWSPNLFFGKLERCPFCGKWAVLDAAPLDRLRAAEQEELQAAESAGATTPQSEQDRLRKELEDSRYQDL